MGMCCQPTEKQQIHQQQQFIKQSLFLSDSSLNDYRFLICLRTYAASEIILKRLSNNPGIDKQDSQVLSSHLDEINQLLAQIQDPESIVSKRIAQYKQKGSIFFLQVLKVVLTQSKKQSNQILMKIVMENDAPFTIKVQLKKGCWESNGSVFLEWSGITQRSQVNIVLGELDATITCSDLFSKHFPVSRSINMRKKGFIYSLGTIYFRAQSIKNIGQYKNLINNELTSRKKMIENLINQTSINSFIKSSFYRPKYDQQSKNDLQ